MVQRPHLTRYVSQDVTLLGDLARPGGVTLAFSERMGGYSRPPYASLNLGDACGDDSEVVVANRHRLLQALGARDLAERLVNPRQVHGSDVLVIRSAEDGELERAQMSAREGVDAVVCAAKDVPVLLCSADCMLVVLVAPQAFAVAHSGWRGTYARICAKALEELTRVAHCEASDVLCYVGPHIHACDFEVSPDLVERFALKFGAGVLFDATHVDLGYALRSTLVSEGVRDDCILDELPSTMSCTSRFYSYRAEGGICGRNGAIAVLRDAAEGGDS